MASKLLSIVSTVCIYSACIWGVLRPYEPIEKIHPVLWEGLIQGKDRGYLPLGHEMEPFKPLLPKTGTFSFLSDDQKNEDSVLYKNAQAYLCPIVLNEKPVETFGLVYATKESEADNLIHQNNYRWVLKISKSMGIARKT